MNGLNKKLIIISGLCGIFLFLLILSTIHRLPLYTSPTDGRNQRAEVIANTPDISVNRFPTIRQHTAELTLSAQSFISVSVTQNGQEKILIEKNKDKQLPIASITKLMVALIASDAYKPNHIVTISEHALNVRGLSGIYHAGDRLLFSNALHALLVASHNEIATAMSEQMENTAFIDLMNKKASALGLSHTQFVNVTGLDPQIENDFVNHSTVFDIYQLAKYIKENHPDIFSITTQKEFDLFDVERTFLGTLKNTDKLLDSPDIPFAIIGGKTGETPRAKQNLVIVTQAPCGGTIFNVLLNSEHRFEDMQKLLTYINNSYDWQCKNQNP